MTLADSEILRLLHQQAIEIDPFDKGCLQPASYDFHLSGAFRVFTLHDAECIDPKKDQRDLTKLVHKGPDDVFVIHPGEFVLASSDERFGFYGQVAGHIDGKSSLGRLGLLIHSTAGFFDPGFYGYPTLELSNVTSLPIKLYPGMLIGQMRFEPVQGEVTKRYSGKYQNQSKDPQPSAYFRNYE